MFSCHAIARSHFGQRDRGRTTLSSAGQREMQTFRNDPIDAPSTNTGSRTRVTKSAVSGSTVWGEGGTTTAKRRRWSG